MFAHAFSNPVEFTNSSSEEDRCRTINGYGSSVCRVISYMVDQTSADHRQCIHLRDPTSSLPQSENKRRDLSVPLTTKQYNPNSRTRLTPSTQDDYTLTGTWMT
jgi:hypothetical protein